MRIGVQNEKKKLQRSLANNKCCISSFFLLLHHSPNKWHVLSICLRFSGELWAWAKVEPYHSKPINCMGVLNCMFHLLQKTVTAQSYTYWPTVERISSGADYHKERGLRQSQKVICRCATPHIATSTGEKAWAYALLLINDKGKWTEEAGGGKTGQVKQWV